MYRLSPSFAVSLVGPLASAAASAAASVALSVGMSGCSAPVSESVDRDAAEGASSAAVVVVERTVSADETVHASIVARFIRMRAGSVDDDALRMVGATLDLPALDTCAPRVAADSVTPSPLQAEVAMPRAVELMDVGPLAIESEGVRTALEARSLPDIVDLVSGVVYSTRSVEASGLPSRGLYRLSSGGTVEGDQPSFSVPSFSVFGMAPGEPTALTVDAKDARDGDGITVSRSGVELGWAIADGAAPDDLVYVDIASSTSQQAALPVLPTVRCLFADRGVASIPGSAFGLGFERADVEGGVLTVHRVHREAFHVGGIDSGVLRFDFARAIPFTRR